MERSKDFLHSYSSARFMFPISNLTPVVEPWSPLLAPFVKVSFDVALFDHGFFQTAAVVRNFSGDCLGWSVRRFPGLPLPVEGEANAARLAIILAMEKGWSHVHLEGDCLQVINAFNDRDSVGLRSFDTIVAACLELSSRFSAFRCSFIRRSSNCLAHALDHFPLYDSVVLEGVSLPAGLAQLI